MLHRARVIVLSMIALLCGLGMVASSSAYDVGTDILFYFPFTEEPTGVTIAGCSSMDHACNYATFIHTGSLSNVPTHITSWLQDTSGAGNFDQCVSNPTYPFYGLGGGPRGGYIQNLGGFFFGPGKGCPVGAENFSVTTPSTPITIAFWYKGFGESFYPTPVDIISYGDSGNGFNGAKGWKITGQDGYVAITYKATPGGFNDSQPYSTSTGMSTSTGTWNHYAFTIEDGVAIKMYLNGVLKGTVDLTGLAIVSPSGPIRFGRTPDGNGNGQPTFFGSIDELIGYKAVLTAGEILDLKNGTDPLSTAPLTTYKGTQPVSYTPTLAPNYRYSSAGPTNSSWDNPETLQVRADGGRYVLNPVNDGSSNALYDNNNNADSIGGVAYTRITAYTHDHIDHRYIVGAGDRTISMFSKQNSFSALHTIGSGVGPGALSDDVRGLAMDSAGNIFASDTASGSIKVYSHTGATGYFIGSFTPASAPTTINVDKVGNLYILGVDGTLRKYSSGGLLMATLASSGSADGQISAPKQFVVDQNDNIYIADTGNHRMQILSSTGAFLYKYGTQGLGDDKFESPRGIYLEPNGDVVVLDSGNKRLVTLERIPPNADPTVTLIGSGNVYTEYGVLYTDSGATWTDPTDGSGSTLTGLWSQTGSFALSGSVNTGALGTYILEYKKVNTTGGSGSALRTVIVQDTTAPVTTLIGSGSLTINQGSVYTDSGASWTDNYDGSGTAYSGASQWSATGAFAQSGSVNTSLVGTYTIQYRKIDTSGNISNIVTRTITVNPVPDTTPPVVTLSGAASLTISQGSVYTDAGASWTDNFDGSGSTLSGSWSQTGAFASSGSVSTTNTGVYLIQYRKIDLAGNISNTVTRSVTVADITPPALPICSISPTTATGTVTVTITCSAPVETGATVSVPNMICTPSPSTGSGVVCTGVSSIIGNNPVLTIRDPSNNSTGTTLVFTYTAPSGGGSGGGGGGSPGMTPITPITSPNPPVTTLPTPVKDTKTQILPTQSFVTPVGPNTQGKDIFTLENRLTDVVCPQIVKVYDRTDVRTKDIPPVFRDDVAAVVMFRGVEENETSTGGVSFFDDRDMGVAVNDPLYEPDRAITRAEYVKMLVRALSCRYSYLGTDAGFPDVDGQIWYAPYITFASEKGWINGYDDGSFRPNAPISRGEAMKILAKAIELNTGAVTSSSFADVPKGSSFIAYIEALKKNNVISGKTKDTFDPNAQISRAETAKIVYKVFLGGPR